MASNNGIGTTSRPTMLEVFANIATIIVSVLLSLVLVRTFLLPPAGRGPATAAASIQSVAGTSLKHSLPDIDWAKNHRTLVLAISTHCHFCTESAPFFKRIGKEKAQNVKLLAVLPQPVQEARQYLDGEGVRVDDVRQASPQSIGVSGTPTLLLVDSSGTVSQVWRGKLGPSDEDMVIAALRSNAAR